MRTFEGLRLFNQRPFEGGYLDQPEDLMQDAKDCFILYANESVFIQPEIEAFRKKQYEERNKPPTKFMG